MASSKSYGHPCGLFDCSRKASVRNSTIAWDFLEHLPKKGSHMTDNGKTRTPGVYKKEGQERSRRHRVNVIVLSPIFTASETVKLGLPRLGNSVANPSSNING